MDFFNPIEWEFLKQLVLKRNPFETEQPQKETFRDPIKDLNEANNYLAQTKSSNENLNNTSNLDDQKIDAFLKSIKLDNIDKKPLKQTTTSKINKQPIAQSPTSQLNQPVTQQTNQQQPISQKSYITPEDLKDPELEEAQERARKNELFALLSKAVNQFGSGLSGAIASKSGFGAIIPSTKASDEFSSELLKLANRPVEDVLLKRKQEQERLKTLTDKQKLELQQRLSDPSSDISKMARALYEKAMGRKLPDNVSAMDIQVAGFDSIVRALVDQETNKIRLQEMMQDKIMKSDTKMAERLDKMDQDESKVLKQYEDAYMLINQSLKDPAAVELLGRALIKISEGASARISDKDLKDIFGTSNLDQIREKINRELKGTFSSKKAQELRGIIDRLYNNDKKYYSKLKEDMFNRYVNIQKQKGRSEEELRDILLVPKKETKDDNDAKINNLVEQLLPKLKENNPNLPDDQARQILRNRIKAQIQKGK